MLMLISTFRKPVQANPTSNSKKEGEHSMELPQIVRTYIDTFCRQDLEAWLGTFAPGGTYSDPGTAQPLSGQAMNDYFAGFFAGFHDVIFETVAVDSIPEDLE